MSDTQQKKQAGNIDEQGNVLYLDEARLARKIVGFPPYKNKPNGLGITNFLVEHVIYMRKSIWPLALKLYRMFVRFSVWMKEGGVKALIYKKGIRLHPDMEAHTGTLVMPLNVDVTDKGEKVVVPMDLIKNCIRRATFVAGMDVCLCREANDCKDYPKDMACLFFGEPGRTVVRHGLGREFTVEEACARVDRAAELGLMGQAVWIEVEQLLWGIRNDQMDQLLEICFCCPCCCIAMRLARNATEKERHRFHPVGWTAVPDRTKCVGCGRCVSGMNGCPVEAISFGKDGKVIINQEICVGCGICKSRCSRKAIRIRQTMPMREDIHDYFKTDYNLDLKVWANVKDEEREKESDA